MKTKLMKVGEVKPKWYLIDAKDKVLGRMASRIARVLTGKDSPAYTPHVQTGDWVVVINAASVRVTGKKRTDKQYFRNTEYPGGLRVETFEGLMAKAPERAVQFAVRRMLPKTKLGDRMLDQLKVYPGVEHPHQAQQPIPLELR